MESLALLVSLLLGTIVFSGPFALLLTWSRIRTLSDGRIFLIIRRLIMAVAALLGAFLSAIFIVTSIPFIVKVFSVLCIAVHLWAMDREYGRFISSRLRRNG